MRAWRTTTGGILVELGRTRESVPDLQITDWPEGPWRALQEYRLIDHAGSQVAHYGVRSWSLEDDLGLIAHAVIDGALLKRVRMSERSTMGRDEIVLDGLCEVDSDDAGTWALIDGALAESAQRQREIVATRIEAVPGAEADYDAGTDFASAQRALLRRVRAYGDALDTALLRGLVRFGSIYRWFGPSRRTDEAFASFAASMAAFTRACQYAAFEPMVDPRPAPWSIDPVQGIPDGERAEFRALAGVLRTLHRSLVQAAERQEAGDAIRNAVAYRRAAEWVGDAIIRLEAMGTVPP